jgi:hypothetical protein
MLVDLQKAHTYGGCASQDLVVVALIAHGFLAVFVRFLLTVNVEPDADTKECAARPLSVTDACVSAAATAVDAAAMFQECLKGSDSRSGFSLLGTAAMIELYNWDAQAAYRKDHRRHGGRRAREGASCLRMCKPGAASRLLRRHRWGHDFPHA